MPKHVHTYRLTPQSLWNACAAGTLTEDDIGEFSGRSKDIRPVTIATYQVLTHRV